MTTKASPFPVEQKPEINIFQRALIHELMEYEEGLTVEAVSQSVSSEYRTPQAVCGWKRGYVVDGGPCVSFIEC